MHVSRPPPPLLWWPGTCVPLHLLTHHWALKDVLSDGAGGGERSSALRGACLETAAEQRALVLSGENRGSWTRTGCPLAGGLTAPEDGEPTPLSCLERVPFKQLCEPL
ncbi:unnamed protein product [Rangifer tarandus platyrhynchus]|uniref:Uncharacterized protein n=2 Tax=Rangifer tarandus platyrhynchus TaxID=3082113 RepID=A0ABN8YU20_RANTA|nr:unnamed protein product [Rangifer tarandus platyrhynchus]CAI9702445.1 unnamed protein product [Rangifer tarandus platyrhynchus]